MHDADTGTVELMAQGKAKIKDTDDALIRAQKVRPPWHPICDAFWGPAGQSVRQMIMLAIGTNQLRCLQRREYPMETECTSRCLVFTCLRNVYVGQVRVQMLCHTIILHTAITIYGKLLCCCPHVHVSIEPAMPADSGGHYSNWDANS